MILRVQANKDQRSWSAWSSAQPDLGLYCLLIVFNDPVSSEDPEQTVFTQLIWAFTVHIPLRHLFSSCHSFLSGYRIHPKYWESLLLLTILLLNLYHSLCWFSRWQTDDVFLTFSKKIGLDISCKGSQTIFSGKNKKKIVCWYFYQDTEWIYLLPADVS